MEDLAAYVEDVPDGWDDVAGVEIVAAAADVAELLAVARVQKKLLMLEEALAVVPAVVAAAAAEQGDLLAEGLFVQPVWQQQGHYRGLSQRFHL